MDRLLLYAADDAAERTIGLGGGTFNRDTLAADGIGRKAGEGRPADAYAVGGIRPTRTIAYPATRSAIADAILAMRALNPTAPYIGTWADDATSTVYVDAVVILPDLESAGILARALGERAIYNLATGETIPADDARAPRCKACDALLNVTVRGHHHSEHGKDATS